ncbi:hypothetical protein [Streptomyces albogriseolus]|uniref:hypothetical protein n=1 Tax=Streptomyces albogriseolus TaxID=1887 RepID=UPI0037F2DF7E
MSQDGLEEERTALAGYGIEIGTEPLHRPARNSVGGWPYFDDGQEWPRCFCGERMALFFQLDVPEDIEFFGPGHGRRPPRAPVRVRVGVGVRLPPAGLPAAL